MPFFYSPEKAISEPQQPLPSKSVFDNIKWPFFRMLGWSGKMWQEV
jgi:hypothetical protein